MPSGCSQESVHNSCNLLVSCATLSKFVRMSFYLFRGGYFVRTHTRKTPGQRVPASMLLVGIFLVLAILLTACGSNSSTGSVPTPNPKTPTVTPPKDLITPGTLTVGSDTTYPPLEYIDTTTNKATGFDVELITAIAQRMGLKVNVVTRKFDTIIDDLSNKRVDVVISDVTINPGRQKKADFVPY